jgi:hypothetical protein
MQVGTDRELFLRKTPSALLARMKPKKENLHRQKNEAGNALEAIQMKSTEPSNSYPTRISHATARRDQ